MLLQYPEADILTQTILSIKHMSSLSASVMRAGGLWKLVLMSTHGTVTERIAVRCSQGLGKTVQAIAFLAALLGKGRGNAATDTRGAQPLA